MAFSEKQLTFRESPGVIWLDDKQLALWLSDGDYREAVMFVAEGLAAEEGRAIRLEASDRFLAIASPE
jgi:hypothetical protein